MKGRKLLMIPGPIEFEPAVMRALGAPTTSHIAPNFIEEFGQALERMRQVFLCAGGQPFIIAGSGTLAMDLAGANLTEPGDAALVVNTGYFGDRMGELLERYGATVEHVRAPVGDAPALEQVEAALKAKPYKLVTITQVDTSTGVLADVAGVARLARAAGALVVVDGVCSVGGEELRMDDWGVDLALTASQKALATPPGLALVVAGPRALAAWRARKTPVGSYYADWAKWLPIMEAYEGRKPSYFGTPAVNLVSALNVSLGQIVAEGMEARFARHRKLSAACKAAITALGLGQLPAAGKRANTMTAPYYPAGVDASVLGKINAAGAILAGGLHPACKAQYFRIGHMGPNSAGDILATIGAVEMGLAAAGYTFEHGAGVAAAQREFMKQEAAFLSATKKSAIEELEPYVDEMLRCTRCGFCQAACPVYEELRTESSVARGKVQLILAVKEGKLEPTETVARYLYRCLDCRLCQQTCPGGVHTDEIFEGGKHFLTEAGLAPAPLAALRQRLDDCHNIAGEDNTHREMWRENLPATCKTDAPCEVAFFTGCVAGLYPMVYSIPQAFVQVLDHAGVGYVTLAGEEWCCGYPLLAAGFAADELMAHNVAGIGALGVKHLVATCPSCYKTWKTVYPKTDFDILHATQMILALLEEGRITPAHPPAISRKAGASGPLRVTYHDPCDLGRKAGVYDPPRQIIARLPGVELVEMTANRALANCCGGGGNMESLEADLSAAIADRRLAQAQAVGAEVIVTACQQCQRTLSMAARRNKVRLPTMDVAQILLATLE